MRTVRVLIGYESVLGNTRRVAEAVADGVRLAVPDAQVQCVQVGRLPPEPPAVDLFVLGGPTHFLRLPGERTRRMWVRGVLEASRGASGDPQHLEPGSAGPGVREWLAELDVPVTPLRTTPRAAAAFDTRQARVLAGGAARGIARGLRQHGYRLLAPPKGFVVEDVTGPLREGEADRALRWGVQLAGLVVPATSTG